MNLLHHCRGNAQGPFEENNKAQRLPARSSGFQTSILRTLAPGVAAFVVFRFRTLALGFSGELEGFGVQDVLGSRTWNYSRCKGWGLAAGSGITFPNLDFQRTHSKECPVTITAPSCRVLRCAGSVDSQPQTRRSNPSLPSRKDHLYYTYNSASRKQSLPYNFKPERAPNYPRGHPYSLTSTTPHIPALNVSCVPGSGSVSTFLTKNLEHQSDILYIGI